jgi:hypothetical protein
MTNNECRLIGWLEIETAKAEVLNGQQVPIIQGYITTGDAVYGYRHPILIKGKVAEAALQWAQQMQGHPPRVMLRGKLHSKEGNTQVVGQYIQFLDMYIDYNLIAQKLQQAIAAGKNNLQEVLADILTENGVGNSAIIEAHNDEVEENTNDEIV